MLGSEGIWNYKEKIVVKDGGKSQKTGKVS